MIEAQSFGCFAVIRESEDIIIDDSFVEDHIYISSQEEGKLETVLIVSKDKKVLVSKNCNISTGGVKNLQVKALTVFELNEGNSILVVYNKKSFHLACLNLNDE